ncbi:MAG: thiamine pyrophosphate-binding protein [Candidatus Staskawiczbacteria bacterium]|nr:thiamine pyrophosphate-binding protein [Candidatus Staskawiczbacteria bacterium]
MIRVADYVTTFIENLGVKDIFMLTGGGAMFLNDAAAQNTNIRGIFNHHEQASAMGAFAYSKQTGNWGACYVTTGCGVTNTITGLLDAWQDNVPVFFISGQVKRPDTISSFGLPLRQYGVQEVPVIPIVQSLCKYSVMVTDPLKIRYHLEKAAYLGKHGRPGPVWLDIPLDVQGTPVDQATLESFNPKELEEPEVPAIPTESMQSVEALLQKAKRPVIIAGHGIRLANALPEFRNFIEKYQIPFVGTYLATDYVPGDHPLFIGRTGLKGDRAGNFAMQNSDLILSIGSRLGVTVIGYNPAHFAREAKIAVVDIDPAEHQKKTIKIDTFVHADAKQFLTHFEPINVPDTSAWRATCLDWKKTYPVSLPEYRQSTKGINLYHFMDDLCRHLPDKATVVADAGSAIYVPAQAFYAKTNQRLILSGAQAEMGFTLPACIGVAATSPTVPVVGLTGDGSLQSNIQELQTIVHYQFPIKLFVWNNDGYLCIRSTQTRIFQGRLYGTDRTNGVSLPDTGKIAQAYGIPFVKLEGSENLGERIKKILETPGPVICEVMCIRDQEIVPTVASKKLEDGRMVSKPLEDLYPFLDREEFKRQMIIKTLED